MVKEFKKRVGIFIVILVALIFYFPLWTAFKIPVPADTIVGLYHPYRDLYAKDFPNGIAYKNFLITDPVRQTYVWKELSLRIFSTGNLPLWNPYEMGGKPLLANFQSGAFYPLNILFLIIGRFEIAWSIFIAAQTVLFGVFMYFFVRNLGFSKYASVLSSLIVSLSGFTISWLEWGNIVHTALWLPLLLLAADKLIMPHQKTVQQQKKESLAWAGIFVLSLCASFFAGHLQIFFYVIVVVFVHVLARLVIRKKFNLIYSFALYYVSFVLITIVQWFPTLQFIMLSNRVADQSQNGEGWFVPYQNLLQLVAPDFFGNPSTLNYFGVWNYAEFVPYVGMLGLIFALFAILFSRDKKTYCFAGVLGLSLLLSTDNIVSRIPFNLQVPFLSTAQPTRLIFLTTFSLAALAGIGLDLFLKKEKRRILIPIGIVAIVIAGLWMLVLLDNSLISKPNLEIAKNNLKLPSVLFFVSSVVLLVMWKVRGSRILSVLTVILVLIVSFDLLRFGWKFETFSDRAYLFPDTKALQFIKHQKGLFRVTNLDKRIMPPNFFTHYGIQTLEGYDPLYLKDYAEFISIYERDDHNPDVSGFNRIITATKYSTQLFDFMNVKYILSFDDIKSPKLTHVFSEGTTKVYENNFAFDRMYFVQDVVIERDPKKLFDIDLRTTAITQDLKLSNLAVGTISNIQYSENLIQLKASIKGNGFLVLSDAYYPSWKAFIDGAETKIYKTNHAFRGIVVPEGEHIVQFKNTLF